MKTESTMRTGLYICVVSTLRASSSSPSSCFLISFCLSEQNVVILKSSLSSMRVNSTSRAAASRGKPEFDVGISGSRTSSRRLSRLLRSFPVSRFISKDNDKPWSRDRRCDILADVERPTSNSASRLCSSCIAICSSWPIYSVLHPGHSLWMLTKHSRPCSSCTAIFSDDDVSFYNSTASTWTLETPITTWEAPSRCIQHFTPDVTYGSSQNNI